MLSDEKKVLVRHLDDGQQALMKALDGAGEKEAEWRPAPGAWSILQCMEHVVLSEEYLLTRLENAMGASVSISAARADAILARGADRNTRVESPEVGRPRGRFALLADAIAGFREARARTMDWVTKSEGDPRSLITDHPIIQGPVNAYEIVTMIAVHPKRHGDQIKEIRARYARSGESV